MSNNETILEIKDLSISFKTSSGVINAVRGVNLKVPKGKTLALVGESGCGKSVTVKTIMGILSNNAIVNSGSINFKFNENGNSVEEDLLKLSRKEMQKRIKGKRIAMIFQDPMTSLDPTMTIGKQITEGMLIHTKISKKEAHEKAVELLEQVGITNARERMSNYPHQLSGGMRQRVVIAIALSCEPELLICDEPTTALDVTIQAKILQLILDLQKRKGLSIIFITHDMGVVAKIADYVNVMYAGKMAEKGTVDDLFYEPVHPYTWGLLSSIPDIGSSDTRLYTIPGNPPNLLELPPGDPFAPRNEYALNIDYRLDPPMIKINEHHEAATWLLHEKAPNIGMPEDLKKKINSMVKEV